jgi:mannose-6-phosphate isomerase-like protein (cupin superfamily)
MSTEAMQAAKIIQPSERKWTPHARFAGVKRADLLNRKDDGFGVTMALDYWSVGADLDRHTHLDCDDIFYVISGKAKIWIEGIGDVPLVAGSFVKVPKGALHQPHSVEEDVVVHHCWYPANV